MKKIIILTLTLGFFQCQTSKKSSTNEDDAATTEFRVSGIEKINFSLTQIVTAFQLKYHAVTNSSLKTSMRS